MPTRSAALTVKVLSSCYGREYTVMMYDVMFNANRFLRVKEEVFWRNYFYRVSLIKQSTQLTSLAQHSGECLQLLSSNAFLIDILVCRHL